MFGRVDLGPWKAGELLGGREKVGFVADLGYTLSMRRGKKKDAETKTIILAGNSIHEWTVSSDFPECAGPYIDNISFTPEGRKLMEGAFFNSLPENWGELDNLTT